MQARAVCSSHEKTSQTANGSMQLRNKHHKDGVELAWRKQSNVSNVVAAWKRSPQKSTVTGSHSVQKTKWRRIKTGVAMQRVSRKKQLLNGCINALSASEVK